MEKTFKENRLKIDDDYYAKEVKAVELFDKEYDNQMASLIVFGQKPETAMQPNEYLTERERKIVLSTIQWLGTPVGQSFIEKLNK